jgi:hypothetical protein
MDHHANSKQCSAYQNDQLRRGGGRALLRGGKAERAKRTNQQKERKRHRKENQVKNGEAKAEV